MRSATKVLVTGASGFVGHSVQTALRSAFYPVSSLLRPSSDCQIVQKMGCRIFRGDVTDKASMVEPLDKGAESIVHLVGIIEERHGATFEKIHVDGTRNIVELAKQYKVSKLVHMSALGSRANGKCSYHKTKWKAEELVRNSGLPYTILRPSVIFGEDSEFLQLIGFLSRVIGFTPILGDGKGRLQPVWVDDIARMIRVCLEDERTDGQTYDIGGPAKFTLDEFFELMERRLYLDENGSLQGYSRKMHVNLPLSLGALAQVPFKIPILDQVLDWVDRAILPLPRVNDDQMVMMQEDNTCDTTPLKAVFDWEFRKFDEWLLSEEFHLKPWSDWKGKWLIPPEKQVDLNRAKY